MSIGKRSFILYLLGRNLFVGKTNILCSHYDIIKNVYYYEDRLLRLTKKFRKTILRTKIKFILFHIDSQEVYALQK